MNNKSHLEFETLDDVLAHIVGPRNQSGVPLKEWALRLGVASSSLYNKCSVSPDIQASFTLRDLRTIVAHGEKLPVEYLASLCHCAVFPLPDGEANGGVSDNVTDHQLATLLKEVGDLVASYAEARQPSSPGGRGFDATEKQLLKIKAHQVLKRIPTLLAHIEAESCPI